MSYPPSIHWRFPKADPNRLFRRNCILRVSARPDHLFVNFLYYPEMKASVDGRPISLAADEWNRIVAQTPAGGKALSVRYAPGWRDGLVFGGCLVVAGIFLGRRLVPNTKRCRALAPARVETEEADRAAALV